MRNYFLILVFILLSSTISAQPSFDLQGHRGARGLAPENTFESCVEALKHQVTTIELDVVISKDGEIIVSHEPWMHPTICLDPEGKRIKKTAPLKHNIYKMTVEKIQQYDCGTLKHPKYPEQKNQKLYKPTLKELILQIEDYITAHQLTSVQYNIEIKCYKMGTGWMHPRPKKFTQLVIDAIKEVGVDRHVMIQSFSYKPLRYLQKHHSEIPLSLLVDDNITLENHIKKLGFTPNIYSPKYTLVDAKLVESAHQKGIIIIPWTVNKKEDIENIIGLGVDGLITDYPNIAQKVLQDDGPYENDSTLIFNAYPTCTKDRGDIVMQ